MAPTKQDIVKFFSVNPNAPVEMELKAGINRVYKTYALKSPALEADARAATLDTLDLLAQFKARPYVAAPPKIKKTRKRVSYNSSRDRKRIEFLHNKVTDEIDTRATPLPTQKPKVTAKQQANKKFKKQMLRFMDKHSASQVGDILAAGVVLLFTENENVEGPFIDAFVEHQAMFAKLKQVYKKENVAELITDRGCYSRWMAVELAVATYEDVQREEDVMGMMG